MASEKDIDNLYGKGKQTSKQAKEQINKAINGNKKSSGSFRFPNKETMEKISKSNKIGKAIDTAKTAGRVVNTTIKSGLGVFNAMTGFDHYVNAKKLQDSANEALRRGDKKRYNELINAAFRERTAGALTLGTLGLGVGAKGVSTGLRGAGNLLKKTAGSPMGRAVYNDLIKRGASKAGVNFMRMRPIVQRNLARGLGKASAITGKIGDAALSYPALIATPYASNLVGRGLELGRNAWDAMNYTDNNQNEDNQAREEFIKTLIDAGYSREEAEKRADEVEYGTGDKGTLTDGGNTEVTKYGYEDPNAVNTRYYGGGTSGSTGGANVAQTTGATTGVPQTTTTASQQPVANQQLQGTDGANKPQEEQSRFTDFVNRANDVYDSWQRSQQYYDPYRNSLNQYINNYRDVYDASMARNRWLSALRGESINPDKFSPLDEEANRIALQKQLASDLEAQENSRNELIGNLGVASEMGLPPESVNASDKYLQSATKYREEEDKIEQRRENQRLKYQTSLEIQQLKGEVQRDIAAGNLRAAAAKAEILKQKNQILYTLGLFTPAINAMPYMDDYSTLLDIMGRTPVGQYFVPQQQIQPVQQVQVQARPQQPKAINRAISADQFVQRFK